MQQTADLTDKKPGALAARLGAYAILAVIVTVVLGKAAAASSHGLFYVYGIFVSLVLCAQFYVAMRRYRDPYEAAQDVLNEMSGARRLAKPLVTVMVAVKDEEEIIERCVKSLKAQTYEPLEIIVVNDGSEDGTARILDMHVDIGKVEVIHLERNIGKKRALAKAMLRAKGSIFAFTDSDSVLAPDAIAKVADVFLTHPEVGAVSGHCRAMNPDTNFLTKVQDTWYEGQFSVRKAFESHFGAVTCVSGPLAVFRREAIYNFIPAWEHDTFLGQEFRFATDRTMTGFVLGSASVGERLKRTHADSPFVRETDYPCREWKIVYCKSARAWTNVPDTVGRIVKQQIRWKKSFIRNMFFSGYLYCRKPLTVMAAYYLHILFVLLGPFIAFRHLVYLPYSGDLFAGIIFLSGIMLVGLIFGLAYRREGDKSGRWLYRPIMSLSSALFLSWLVFYSAFTIRKSVWSRN